MDGNRLMHDDFLLESEEARRLYHGTAAALPIIDYHCHLPPGDIADDVRWENMTRIWLAGDHYKWRAMRWNGVDERYCTGDASDWEKFEQWAATMPRLLRNPLYHWTHLELARYFGYQGLLGPETARAVWDLGNRRLAEPDFSCRGLMLQSRVELVCTTDDPCDSLEAHRRLAADPSFPVRVLPTWRPDRAMAVEDPAAFNAWTDRLAAAAGIEVRDYTSFLEALRKRHAFFHEAGCRLSDHGLETAYAESYTEAGMAAAFDALRAGRPLDDAERDRFKSALLFEFGVMDYERGWTQQYHFGALRNNNLRLFPVLGPDAGFDSIGDFGLARPLARLLGRLDAAGRLPRTILYSLHPGHNEVLVTMAGNFQDGSMPGKIQCGSAWWFLDQLDGMQKQMESLSQMGLLSRFVGMLTDSRSFLSYTRHEYFRRLLCNLLGRDVRRGLLPRDWILLEGMVADICHHNAARYFGFET